jgi:hypothetical protein
VAPVCSHLLNAGSSLADFSTLKMEAIRSSEKSVHTRSTRRHIPEDGILSVQISFLQVYNMACLSLFLDLIALLMPDEGYLL